MAGRLVADPPEQAYGDEEAPHGSYAAVVAAYYLAFAGALLGRAAQSGSKPEG